MNYEYKYAPKTLHEVIFPTVRAEQIIKGMVPDMGRNLILYGPAGTGKTTCAKLIPLEVARARTNNPDLTEVYYISHTGDELNIDKIKQLGEQVGMVNIGQLPKHVIVIDEADRMSPAAMEVLKIAMDKGADRAVWIFCTNKLDKFASPVLSRCTVLDFAQYDEEPMFERAETIFANENVKVPEEKIKGLVRAANGDIRKLNQHLQEVAERRAVQCH